MITTQHDLTSSTATRKYDALRVFQDEYGLATVEWWDSELHEMIPLCTESAIEMRHETNDDYGQKRSEAKQTDDDDE